MARPKKYTKSIAKTTKSTKSSKRTKKVTASKKLAPKKEIKTSSQNQSIYQQLRLSESYVSLILGAVVVLGVFAMFFIFIAESRKTNTATPPAEILDEAINPTNLPASGTPAPGAPVSNGQYVLGENETIWDVAVKFYGDGFRYVEIVDANKLENADYVPPGTSLIIPNVE